jgi:hypothetical protein
MVASPPSITVCGFGTSTGADHSMSGATLLGTHAPCMHVRVVPQSESREQCGKHTPLDSPDPRSSQRAKSSGELGS